MKLGGSGGERYLYAVQWVNPKPEQEIKALRLASDPQKRATVLVLAVTLLD